MKTFAISFFAVFVLFALSASAEDAKTGKVGKESGGIVIDFDALQKKANEQEKCTKRCADGTMIPPDQKCPEEKDTPKPAATVTEKTCPDGKTKFTGGDHERWATCPKQTCDTDGKQHLKGVDCSQFAPKEPPLTVEIAHTCTKPLGCDFECSSPEAQGDISCTWSYGDKSPSELGNEVSHLYKKPGSYTVKVSAKDGKGRPAKAHADVTVTDEQKPPAPKSEPPKAKLKVTCNDPSSDLKCYLDATDSTPGSSPIASYLFDLGNGDKKKGPTAEIIFPSRGTYPVTLTVTATDGQTGKDTVQQTVPAPKNQPPSLTFIQPPPPPAPPPAPLPPPTPAKPTEPGYLHLGGGLNADGMLEFPPTLPKSGRMLRAPFLGNLDVEGILGYRDTNNVFDLVVDVAPFSVLSFSQNDVYGWQMYPSLSVSAAFAWQYRVTPDFDAGLQIGATYQVTNLDFSTGNSLLASIAPTIGPRLTWTLMKGDVAKLDLILRPYVGWDTSYSYRQDDLRVLDTWGSPQFGLSIGLGVSNVGPELGDRSNLVSAKPAGQ